MAAGILVTLGHPREASADLAGPQFTWNQAGLAGRFGASMAYDANRQRVVLFGGRESGGAGALLNDTWTWDGSSWTPRIQTTSPLARSWASMAYDDATGTVVLFGGSGPGMGACDADELCNDTWTWDGATWTEQNPAHSPAARANAAMAYDAAHQQVVLFGGSNNTNGADDTWTWDGSDWTQQSPAHHPTGSYSRGPMTYDGATQTIVLFVGDTWTWDGSDWTQQSPAHSPPNAGGSITYDGDHQEVVLFGGSGDTWTWDGSDWTQKTPLHNPSPRGETAMAYDSSSGSVILFGGRSNTGFPSLDLGDWWTWNGTDWSQESQGNPSGRDFASMVYDQTHRNVVLFGGWRDDVTSVNDTWTWDGSSWTKQSPGTSPPPRGEASMAYDSDHERAVLFGGLENNDVGATYADTWTWDGTDWTEQSPAHSPSPRGYTAMAYDAAEHNVVLFGGSLSSDTWTWDGTDWTQQSRAHSPPARSNGTMAYDPVRQEVVLFGGEGASGYLSDTWTWNGNDWTKETPADSPLPRRSSAMAFDRARGTIVLFGGENHSLGKTLMGVAGETWEWDGNTWTQLFPSNSPTPRYGHTMAFDANDNALVFGGFDVDPGQDSSSWTYGPKPAAIAVVGRSGGTVAAKNSLTSTNPLKTSVMVGSTANGGLVSIAQTRSAKTAPFGFAFPNAQATIAAPRASPDSPLTLKFRLDPSLVSGAPGATVHVFRSEGAREKPIEVAQCSSVGPTSPDPCVSSETTTPGNPVQITVLTSLASTWNFAFPGFSLTAHKLGTGAGAVTSQPWGLFCGPVCRAGFLPRTKVAIVAAPRIGSVFKKWSGDCTGSSTCKLAMSKAHAVTATFVHKPDGAIKLRSDSSYIGNRVYNTAARRQTRKVKAKHGATKIFSIAIHNRGSAIDSYKLKCLGNSTDFDVKYLAGLRGTTRITRAVVAGTYALRRIRAGATKYIRMVITVRHTAPIGSTFKRLVVARSVHARTARDAIRGLVRVQG
jgi:hypothetical protein